jgi:hypothetical protein
MLDIKDIATDIRKTREALLDGFKKGIVNPHHLPQIATIFEEVGTLKEQGSYLIAAMLLNNLDANLRKLPPDIRYLDEALKDDVGKLVKEVAEALIKLEGALVSNGHDSLYDAYSNLAVRVVHTSERADQISKMLPVVPPEFIE